MIWMMSLRLCSHCGFFFYRFLVCSEADDSQFSMMRLQDPIEFGGPNRGSEKKINRRRNRSRETERKEKESTRDRWRKKEEETSEKRTRKGSVERDGKKDKWTAKQKGTCGQPEGVAVQRWETASKEGGGAWARGRGERGIKQPRHRIVKGKVLLLRPPTDPRLELIGFKGELFGHLQRHVLFLSSVVRGPTMLAFLYYLLCARAAKERETHLNFTGQFSLISFRHSASFLYCDCVCIGLSNQSQEKEFLDWLVLTLSQ